jgi:CRISPR-associated protein Csx14
MSKKLLIATLGTSPAVITEAIDLLAAEHIPLDGVKLLRTQDNDVEHAFNLLAEHLPVHDKISWIEPVLISAYEDVDKPESAVEFMQQACQTLKTYRDAEYELYVSIAGGRKAMSALLALAVQFYGAKRLFHVWAPPLIEEEGEIHKLRNLRDYPDRLNEKLHPPLNVAESDRPRLVDLPFIGLFSLLPDVLKGLRRENVDRLVRDFLISGGLLTTQGESTALGESVKRILEGVEGLPPARPSECVIQKFQHHYQRELNNFAQQLSARFPFVSEIRGIA